MMGFPAKIQPGDVIGGRYEIYRKLGVGGFGLVYLAYRRDTTEVVAFKTFRDEFLADLAARKAFKREALLWVNLENHPFILRARWIQEFSGRLFVEMDYIAPDERGRVSLQDHLATSVGSLNTDQALRWAIQFCHAMEHANTHGIRCHRDIKPANILIRQDGTLLVTDFGVARATEIAWHAGGERDASSIAIQGRTLDMSLMQTGGKGVCGTPGYMAPELYRGEEAQIQSDIYSFGLVLCQMATGNPMPPWPVRFDGDVGKYLDGVCRCQASGYMPPVSELWQSIVKRCLALAPEKRYAQFEEIRLDLERLYSQRTGRTVELPRCGAQSVDYWINRGASLSSLGLCEEAIRCYDRAIDIDPQCDAAWSNRGNSLSALGRGTEAIRCHDNAIEINPKNPRIWCHKGSSLAELARHEEAIQCYDKATEIDTRYAYAWTNKSDSLAALGRLKEAIGCCDKALEIDSRDTFAWNNKGTSLNALGQRKEAIACYDIALEIDPLLPSALTNKGNAFAKLGNRQEASILHDKALEIDPRFAIAWNNKGNNLAALTQREEAICCFDKAIEINSRDATAWYNKANSLAALERREEAIFCFDKALMIDPRHVSALNNRGKSLATLGRHGEAINSYEEALEINPQEFKAWNNKGISLAALSEDEEAIYCYKKALEINPEHASAWYYRGKAEEILGQSEDAANSYRRFLALGMEEHPALAVKVQERLQRLDIEET
jgi:tetratricopeptide (TPR) repeat protein